MKKVQFVSVLAIFLGSFHFACSKEEKKSKQVLPLISESVNKAKASGFAGATTLTSLQLTTTPTEAAEALKDFLSDTVQSISGTMNNGWIDAYIADLDGRVKEVTNEDEPSCLSSNAIEVSFSTGISGHSISLPLQCVRTFGGANDRSGTGSGLAYGRVGNKYYMYLLLIQQTNTNDRFGYAASIDKDTDDVDLLFLENFPTASRIKFFHLKTTASPKKFEFVVAGSGDGVGPASSATAHILSAGTRFISNDSLLRAEGTASMATSMTGDPTGSTFSFDSSECFNATNLATTPSACTNAAPSFSTSMPLVTAPSVVANGNNILASLKSIQEIIALGVATE